MEWDAQLACDWEKLLSLARDEDLDKAGDCTTQALVPPTSQGSACIVAREPGVVCGLFAAEMTFRAMGDDFTISRELVDGATVQRGAVLMHVVGRAGRLLTAERTVLNVLGRLSGIATLARRYVDAVSGTGARIYDTRKTTPGWRRLEKYAVRCGGGHNHRSGLYDAVLIKDNHLAFCQGQHTGKIEPAAAVRQARAWLSQHSLRDDGDPPIVEIEVDTLEQLVEVLPVRPDIVLLDNMTPEELRRAVALRDADGFGVELEASGGIHLDSVAAVAATGVERISVGALTHGAVSLDVGLDWD
ncbi:MAG: carboxylating nicotinate-nucleotide diphosphorylase [Planctomycetales bacterium]|nr:carboxylating nicotinate-nucleotide diphosphorylase [Planctomycetales bacterium]